MISEKRKETYKMKNCGISRWDDPAEINRKLKYLTSQPIWEVDDDYYDNVVMKYFDEKCKGSREIYEESQKYIPGGVQHNLAFNKPFPMCMAKTDGAYLYDQDGNEYIDFLQAGGPTILGSNYPVVREKVIDLLNTCGPVTGLLHESEMLIAKEINKHMPNVEMFRIRNRLWQRCVLHGSRRITSGSSRSEGLITAGRIRWYTVLRSREAERCWNPMESRGERIS